MRVLPHLGQEGLKYWAWVASAKIPVEVKQQDLKHATDSLTYNRFKLFLPRPQPDSCVDFEE